MPHANLRARMPLLNPHLDHSSSFPLVPISPESGTVALPAMTPRRLSDDTMSESSTMVKRSERNRMSGSTAVELDLSEDAGRLEKEKDADCDVVIESDAEEAKINRKVGASWPCHDLTS